MTSAKKKMLNKLIKEVHKLLLFQTNLLKYRVRAIEIFHQWATIKSVSPTLADIQTYKTAFNGIPGLFRKPLCTNTVVTIS